MNKFLLFFGTLFTTMFASAQDVEMADSFRQDGKIYIVIAVLSVVFISLALYLWRIDSRIGKVEKEIREEK